MSLSIAQIEKLERAKARRGLNPQERQLVEAERDRLAHTIRSQAEVDAALRAGDKIRQHTDEYNHFHRVARLLDRY